MNRLKRGVLEFVAVKAPTPAVCKREESPDIVECSPPEAAPQPSEALSPEGRENEPNNGELDDFHVDKGRTDARDSTHRSERGNSHSGQNHRDHSVSVKSHPYVVDLRQKFKKKRRQVDELEEEVEDLYRSLELERSKHQATKNQLAEKSAELQAANVFLSQADSFSCADIVNLTEALNFDIEQVSAQIAASFGNFEPVLPNEASTRDRDGKIHRAQQGINEFIEADLGKAWNSPITQNDQGVRIAWIQFMLQACIVKFLYCQICRSWSDDPNLETALSHVYERLVHRNSVFRPIAGRWRTLTHAVCSEAIPAEQLAEQALFGSRQVLVAFGGIDTISIEEFIATFRGEVEPIVANLVKINTAIKQKISSVRIFPWIPPPGSRFDPDQMIDTDTPDYRPDGDHEVAVFASVSLGLGKASNTEDDGEIILKANVVLENLLPSMKPMDGVEDAGV